MIPKECKRLAEVDFPIAVVSRHSAREKSIRHGHPSTLHLWWARRPLAACRAMLMALLLPDPCDSNCPEEFKQRARNILPRAQGAVGEKDSDLRNELLRFIGDFANWNNSSSPLFLEAARGLVRAAHGEEPPLVVDPFAGGGSIPLEALRIGCDAFASDLNPVACLILKTMLEDIPRHGPGLADELRKVGAEIKAAAEKELAEFYPLDADGSKPIAYLWARTITCDSCGAEIPLVRSFWLCKKTARKRALRYTVERRKGKPPRIVLDVFEPKKDSDVPPASVSRAKATCLCCNIVTSPDRVRAQLRESKGGSDPLFAKDGSRTGGAMLLAVVSTHRGSIGRHYRLGEARDYALVRRAQQRLQTPLNTETVAGLPLLPHEPTPAGGGSGAGRAFFIRSYGMLTFADLFTARQKLALITHVRIIRALNCSQAAKEFMGLALSRFSDIANALLQWKSTSTQAVHMFTRQAIQMIWDFPEPAIFANASGDFSVTLSSMIRVVESVQSGGNAVQVHVADATQHPLPSESASVLFTDPPYYDAIPYSDLSDFFFVWLKRCLPDHSLLRDPFNKSNTLTPKECEIVQDETKSFDAQPKDRRFFEERMALAFADGRRLLADGGAACIVFAHKTTEGWEALLSGLVKARWVITASWPLATEMGERLRARDSAALATSIHLICRPRSEEAPIGDWGDVLRELPQRVGDWIERLQTEGIKGADLVFACIGPAMEIYSRYRHVEDAEGREIPLGGDPTSTEPCQRGFLAYVWETVGRLALEEVLGTAEARARNGAAGALEEDSRLTALFLWTMQSTQTDLEASSGDGDEEVSTEDEEEGAKPKKAKSGYTLIYDVARRFAQPLGIHLEKWEGRIIETEKGIVRLLPVTERASSLFGEEDAAAISRRIEQDVKASRNYAFAFMQDAGAAPEIKARGRKAAAKSGAAVVEEPAPQSVTTLDRLHAAMLLQRSGQTNGLRALLKEEMQRGPDFLRLANALSRLYPKDSDEKRLLDGMVQAIPKS